MTEMSVPESRLFVVDIVRQNVSYFENVLKNVRLNIKEYIVFANSDIFSYLRVHMCFNCCK